MSKKLVWFSIDEIGEKLGVETRDLVIPTGEVIKQPVWTKADFAEGLKELDHLTDTDVIYSVTNNHDPWLLTGFAYALKQKFGTAPHYQYPAPPTPKLSGWDIDLSPLSVGEQENNYDVVYEVIEDGDSIYLNLNSDDPNADMSKFSGPHTFDPNNTDKILIPALPKDKHLYIHAKGMFCVMVKVAMSYADDCRSLSIAAHDDDYTCCVSHCDEIQPGDVTKRTIPNNL